MERSNDMEARRSFSGAVSPLQEGKHNKACNVNSKKIQCRIVSIVYSLVWYVLYTQYLLQSS